MAMAAQEAQEMRDREAAVAAGLVLTEPSTPRRARQRMCLSKALERLQFMLDRPESDKGASGPVDEGDVDMGDEVPSDKAPPAKKMRGFVAASKPSHAVENKLVTLEPVANKAGYFKVMDLPDAFPLLPASAAALLRDITVLEMGSGVRPDEDPAPAGGGVALAVPAEQVGFARVRSIPGAFGHLRVRGHHLPLADLKPAWFQQQDGGSQGASVAPIWGGPHRRRTPWMRSRWRRWSPWTSGWILGRRSSRWMRMWRPLKSRRTTGCG